MDFHDVDETSSMYDVAVQVADDLRQHLDELYRAQHVRNQEMDGNMANVVLAGLTIVWLEAIHTSWNTPYGESALSVMQGVRPDAEDTYLEMKQAARDFLRRSRWLLRRARS